jgi:hypothetical protein
LATAAAGRLAGIGYPYRGRAASMFFTALTFFVAQIPAIGAAGVWFVRGADRGRDRASLHGLSGAWASWPSAHRQHRQALPHWATPMGGVFFAPSAVWRVGMVGLSFGLPPSRRFTAHVPARFPSTFANPICAVNSWLTRRKWL